MEIRRTKRGMRPAIAGSEFLPRLGPTTQGCGILHPAGRRERTDMNKHTNTPPPSVWRVSRLRLGLQVTSAGSTLQTAAKQQQWRPWRPSPLSVVGFGWVQRFLLFLLLVFSANEPLAGEVLEYDVIVTEGRRMWLRLVQSFGTTSSICCRHKQTGGQNYSYPGKFRFKVIA